MRRMFLISQLLTVWDILQNGLVISGIAENQTKSSKVEMSISELQHRCVGRKVRRIMHEVGNSEHEGNRNVIQNQKKNKVLKNTIN